MNCHTDWDYKAGTVNMADVADASASRIEVFSQHQNGPQSALKSGLLDSKPRK